MERKKSRDKTSKEKQGKKFYEKRQVETATIKTEKKKELERYNSKEILALITHHSQEGNYVHVNATRDEGRGKQAVCGRV